MYPRVNFRRKRKMERERELLLTEGESEGEKREGYQPPVRTCECTAQPGHCLSRKP